MTQLARCCRLPDALRGSCQPCPASRTVPLLQHDMTTFVEACPAGQYDLVFASFAVHHLRCDPVFASCALTIFCICIVCGAPFQVGFWAGQRTRCWLACLQHGCLLPAASCPHCSRGVQLRLTRVSAALAACCSTHTSWASCLSHCRSLEGKASFLRHSLPSQPTHCPHKMNLPPPPVAPAAWKARRVFCAPWPAACAPAAPLCWSTSSRERRRAGRNGWPASELTCRRRLIQVGPLLRLFRCELLMCVAEHRGRAWSGTEPTCRKW